MPQFETGSAKLSISSIVTPQQTRVTTADDVNNLLGTVAKTTDDMVKVVDNETMTDKSRRYNEARAAYQKGLETANGDPFSTNEVWGKFKADTQALIDEGGFINQESQNKLQGTIINEISQRELYHNNMQRQYNESRLNDSIAEQAVAFGNDSRGLMTKAKELAQLYDVKDMNKVSETVIKIFKNRAIASLSEAGDSLNKEMITNQENIFKDLAKDDTKLEGKAYYNEAITALKVFKNQYNETGKAIIKEKIATEYYVNNPGKFKEDMAKYDLSSATKEILTLSNTAHTKAFNEKKLDEIITAVVSNPKPSKEDVASANRAMKAAGKTEEFISSFNAKIENKEDVYKNKEVQKKADAIYNNTLIKLNSSGVAQDPDVFDSQMNASKGAVAVDFGNRADGSKKGVGWLGILPLSDGSVATEYSVGVNINGKEVEIPTLVPTLTKDEVKLMTEDIIPNHKKVPDSIMDKAIEHANSRIAQNKSPFYESNIVSGASKVDQENSYTNRLVFTMQNDFNSFLSSHIERLPGYTHTAIKAFADRKVNEIYSSKDPLIEPKKMDLIAQIYTQYGSAGVVKENIQAKYKNPDTFDQAYSEYKWLAGAIPNSITKLLGSDTIEQLELYNKLKAQAGNTINPLALYEKVEKAVATPVDFNEPRVKDAYKEFNKYVSDNGISEYAGQKAQLNSLLKLGYGAEDAIKQLKDKRKLKEVGAGIDMFEYPYDLNHQQKEHVVTLFNYLKDSVSSQYDGIKYHPGTQTMWISENGFYGKNTGLSFSVWAEITEKLRQADKNNGKVLGKKAAREAKEIEAERITGGYYD